MSTITSSTTSPDKSSLLTIPREIRDSIYAELLYAVNPIPSPGAVGRRYAEINERIDIWNVYLSSERFPAHTNLNVLLCCHQTHNELSQLLALKKPLRQKLDFTLDCIMDWKSIWLTWPVYPGTSATKIHTLEIDLRICPDEFSGSDLKYYARRINTALICLLRRFLHCGSRLTAPPPASDRLDHDMHVDTLRVNILPRTMENTEHGAFSRECPRATCDLGEFVSVRAEELLRSDTSARKVSRLVVYCGELMFDRAIGH